MQGSILMMNQVFSLLIQEEQQREVIPNNLLVMEFASMNVNIHRNKNFKTNYSPNNYPLNSMPRPYYDYWKRPEHTKDRWFKLHRYRQNSNSNPGSIQAKGLWFTCIAHPLNPCHLRMMKWFIRIVIPLSTYLRKNMGSSLTCYNIFTLVVEERAYALLIWLVELQTL